MRAFAAEYEAGAGTPAIIESAAGFAIGASSGAWDEAALRQTLGDRIFHAGGVNFRLSDYFDYAATNDDDQPLYLFDPTFGASAPELLNEYEPPPHFRDDLFALLDGADRPDYRWLLIGGARSGQSWHKDPNMSSAWNLTLRGRKRWLFFPPHVTPPGVFPTSTDGGHDYATPIALAEWARDHYAEACRTPGFVEAETGPGDVTFVPRGWWHMDLNVAPLTVAVSHHFVSPAGLYTTLRLLRTTPHQVSGIDRGLTRDRGDDAGAMTAEEREAADHARRTASASRSTIASSPRCARNVSRRSRRRRRRWRPRRPPRAVGAQAAVAPEETGRRLRSSASYSVTELPDLPPADPKPSQQRRRPPSGVSPLAARRVAQQRAAWLAPCRRCDECIRLRFDLQQARRRSARFNGGSAAGPPSSATQLSSAVASVAGGGDDGDDGRAREREIPLVRRARAAVKPSQQRGAL